MQLYHSLHIHSLLKHNLPQISSSREMNSVEGFVCYYPTLLQKYTPLLHIQSIKISPLQDSVSSNFCAHDLMYSSISSNFFIVWGLALLIMFFFFADIPSTSYSTMPSWGEISFRIFPILQFSVLRTFISILILTVSPLDSLIAKDHLVPTATCNFFQKASTK